MVAVPKVLNFFLKLTLGAKPLEARGEAASVLKFIVKKLCFPKYHSNRQIKYCYIRESFITIRATRAHLLIGGGGGDTPLI